MRGESGPVVLFLGRIARKKGIDVLIRAFGAVLRDVPDAWLVVAGPDDDGLTPSLRRLAEREGVARCVVFTGMLTGAPKLASLAAADMWALPSHGENFGNAVVEAMAASRAVVVSPEVNIACAIEAAGAGIVAPRTPAAFADAIGGLLRDERRRHALGEAGRAFARGYDWSVVAPQLHAMYSEVLRRGELAA
jgi:glycosyltransferase involved in cell wall biosynthesis